MPAPAYIDFGALSPSTRAAVLKDYRATIGRLKRPLTYTEACTFYGIAPDTIRRYVWEGRLSLTTPKGKGAKPGLTHEELRAFVKGYEPRSVDFKPTRLRMPIESRHGHKAPPKDPAQLSIPVPITKRRK